jgi:hypothetical protein
MRHVEILPIALLVLLSSVFSASARGRYQEPAEFINTSFGGQTPIVSKLWVTKETKAEIEKIMDRKWTSLRIRYWQRDSKLAFVLDEISKERPITAGIIVTDGKIDRVKVLIYRESRGWEVRHAFFTDQFKGAAQDPRGQLDREIDGISGATLSVRALTRLSRLSLYLQQQCINAE